MPTAYATAAERITWIALRILTAAVLVFLVFVVGAAEIAIAIPILLLLARARRLSSSVADVVNTTLRANARRPGARSRQARL